MESNNTNHRPDNVIKRQNKYTLSTTQLKTIFQYLQNHIATASMTAEATGIPQKSICRYKRDLEKRGLLCEVRKGLCELTKFRAWYLTANPDLFPKSNQLQLF
jgi:DNA-binding MarR family transcriptional regulator